MSDLAALWTTLAAFFVVAASPGPATLGCASVAMAHGRRAGVAVAVGLSFGLAAWGALAAMGLGAVLVASEKLLFALKLVGGAYLLWLAWGSGRAALRRDGADAAPTETPGRWFWKGFALNLSNPKAVFAWLATLAIGLAPGDGPATVVLATVFCSVLGLAIYLVWALGFSHWRVMAGYRRFRRWIEATTAALFAAAGLGVIRSAFARPGW